MSKNNTVLLLTANYGNGHNQVAQTLYKQLEKKGYHVVLSDLFGETYPTLALFTQSLLIKSFSYGKQLYKWFYYGTDKLSSKGLAHFYQHIGKKRFTHLVQLYQPSFVMTTFPFHVAPFIKKRERLPIPIYTVITDYCVHPLWIHPMIDKYFVATTEIKQKLLQFGVKEKRIIVSGIPIRESFYELPKYESIYQHLHLSKHKKTVFFLAGAFGTVKNAKEICSELLKNPFTQIIAVCGNNEQLLEKLHPLALSYPNSFRLLPYIENIHELFHIADCIITKPGGITLTEATVTTTPLVLYKPTPGQEEENSRYFQRKGCAIIAHNPNEAIQAVSELLHNDIKREQMIQEFHQLNVGNATETIVNQISLSNNVITQKEAIR